MTEDLLRGFRSFRQQSYEGKNALMPELVEKGQSPDYFIISCIDSRTNSATIFNTAPGIFFAHKAMGAIVRPYKQGTALSAALQFAIKYNNVKTIIILGHTGCGAIKALIEGLDDTEIASFVNVAALGLQQAKIKSKTSTQTPLSRLTEEEIVLLSRDNLKGYPVIAEALKNNEISIKCWLFEMENGTLLEHDDNTNSFKRIA